MMYVFMYLCVWEKDATDSEAGLQYWKWKWLCKLVSRTMTGLIKSDKSLMSELSIKSALQYSTLPSWSLSNHG